MTEFELTLDPFSPLAEVLPSYDRMVRFATSDAHDQMANSMAYQIVDQYNCLVMQNGMAQKPDQSCLVDRMAVHSTVSQTVHSCSDHCIVAMQLNSEVVESQHCLRFAEVLDPALMSRMVPAMLCIVAYSNRSAVRLEIVRVDRCRRDFLGQHSGTHLGHQMNLVHFVRIHQDHCLDYLTYFLVLFSTQHLYHLNLAASLSMGAVRFVYLILCGTRMSFVAINWLPFISRLLRPHMLHHEMRRIQNQKFKSHSYLSFLLKFVKYKEFNSL